MKANCLTSSKAIRRTVINHLYVRLINLFIFPRVLCRLLLIKSCYPVNHNTIFLNAFADYPIFLMCRPYELIAVATCKGIAIWHLGLTPESDGRLSTEKVALLSGHDCEVYLIEEHYLCFSLTLIFWCTRLRRSSAYHYHSPCHQICDASLQGS